MVSRRDQVTFRVTSRRSATQKASMQIRLCSRGHAANLRRRIAIISKHVSETASAIANQDVRRPIKLSKPAMARFRDCRAPHALLEVLNCTMSRAIAAQSLAALVLVGSRAPGCHLEIQSRRDGAGAPADPAR